MFKKIIVILFVFLSLGCLGFLANFSLAQAQVDSPEEYQANKLSLLKLYQQQIQAYQKVYRQYDIATTQYNQLGTIVSLGELVDLTRETMKQRGDVVLTYIDILHLELRFAANVDLKQKQDLLDLLEQLHTDFQLQQNLISNSQDYKAINARAETFADLVDRLEYGALRTKAIIYTGKIEGTNLQSQSFLEQIESGYKQNPGTNIRAVERQRAKDQIADAFDQLKPLRSDVVELALEEDGDQKWYAIYLTKLVAVQNQLLLVLAYLVEASRL